MLRPNMGVGFSKTPSALMQVVKTSIVLKVTRQITYLIQVD